MRVWGGGSKNPSLGITVFHQSTSLVRPNGDPGDGYFDPILTLMAYSICYAIRQAARFLTYKLKCIINLLVPQTNLNHQESRSAVGNVSAYRCASDCRSRGREFYPGSVPYFRGYWPWNHFHGHSPPFRLFIQGGFLSLTCESICTNFWLTARSSLSRKKCVYVNWPSHMTIHVAVDLERKATK